MIRHYPALASPLSSPAAPRHRLSSRIISALASPLIHSALASGLRPSTRTATPAGSTQLSSRGGRSTRNAGQRLGSRIRLAAGETPEQVRQYFVQRYGEWILLAPPKEGFNLLVWTVHFVGLGAGLVLVVIVLRRWSRKPAAVPSTPVDPAMRERIRREMSGGGHP